MSENNRRKQKKRLHRLEALEARRHLAAHIVGNSTSYPTIQAAVDAASPGATINVDAGTYDETVVITKSLNIRGAQAGVDARNARGSESIVYATQTVFDVNANDVTIDGFTIEGDDADIGAQLGAGVLMRPSIHGTHVINDVIQSNVTGVYLSNNSNTDQCLIQHCLIQNNFEANNNWQTKQENGSRGIYTDGTVSGGYLTNVLIDSNHIANSNFNGGDEDEGIIALQALTAGKQFNITISNNYLGSESKAILATNVTNLSLIGNTVTGLQDASSGPLRFEGNANTVNIQYNSVYGNKGPGVAADSSGVSGNSSGFVVNNNNIYQNDGIGVLVIANVYDGPLITVGDWWGSASGPGGDGPGTGQAVWANGNSGHGVNPTGAAGGGPVTYSPWATSLINIAAIPVPAAASALTVAPAAASQLTLNWTAPMSTATSQLIQRSTDGVNFVTVAAVPPLLTSFTDSGLTTGTTYTYRVVTSNATGNGAASNTAAGVPPAYQAPVPANGITEASASSNSISLQWNAPYYQYGIANYTIYRNGTAVGTSTTTSFTDSGLTPDTAYTYTITTTDITGATSAPSAPVSLVSGPSQFLDPSFELTPASNSYDPVTANWTFTGNSAIEYSGGAFGTVTGIPDGSQFAVIQGANGGTIGAISQTMTVKTTGAYNISLYAAQRSGYTAEPVTVSMDGTLLGTFTPSSNGFVKFTTAAFSLYAGTHTFKFTGTKNTGDNDSFIDLVSLNLVGNASVPGTPVLTSLGAGSATSTFLSWAPGGVGATSYAVLRSTDGTNWTTAVSNLSPSTTSYVDSGLSASTTYYYEVVATNNGIGSSGPSNVLSATTLSSAAAVTPLSSLNWTSATSGYRTVQKNASVQGNTLTLHNTTYASGLGTSAASVITYSLGGGYSQFTTDVGIDAEENTQGGTIASVDFQVIGDGKVLFDSGDLGINSPVVHIAVPVSGVQTLTLVATNGVAGIAYDHADWAGAQLFTNPTVPATPTNVAATAASTSSVTLTWTPNSSNQTSFAIDRSTDGVNFTTIASAVAASATSYTDSSGLAASTTYYYRIRAVNAAGASANSAVVNATTLNAAYVTTPISSLNWTSATAGYGTVQKNTTISGNTITLHGVTYASGLGTHAASTITYNLGGNYSSFVSDVGIDDEEIGKGSGSVDFQVIGDGKVLFDSGVLTSSSATVSINVSVAGVQTLQLVANNGIANNIDYDHADWAGARLISSPAQALVAPSNLTAAAVSATQVNLAWTSTAVNATGFIVARSTDGTNFTPIASNLPANATSYSDTTAAASTGYFYEVFATASGISSKASNIASATTIAANSVTTNLSALNWTSATAGYGSVQKNATVSGNTITLHGVTYTSGLGTHAASSIVYNLGGNYTNFLSDIGIDDEEIGKGSGNVDFQVVGDGKVLFDSGVLTSSSPTVSVNVSVAGVQTLTLVANNGIANDIDYDHADWAGARLLSSAAQALVAPSNLVAAGVSPTQVNLSWTSTAINATGFTVARSTDGVTFTTIASGLPANATSYSDTTAAGSTTYYYEVFATVSGITSKASNVASTTTVSASAISTNLSSLNWTSATAGYGTVQKDTTIAGNTITLHGVTYASGIGTHAASTITYNLAGAYTNFLSDVGIDDEEIGRGSGSVDFQVIGDGKVLFDSGILTSSSPTVSINVSVAGVQTLQLVANNGIAYNIDYDHADWAGARLLSNPVLPTAPTNLVAVGIGSSLIKLNWTASTNQTSYVVDRSTDGINFTTVATNISGNATTWTDTSVLSASTTYYYQIRAVSSAGTSANSNIASGTTLALASVTYVSDLTAVSATTGYGSVQQDKSVAGNPLTLNGVVYNKGIGTHAASVITYNIAGKFSSFFCDVGIDQEEDAKGQGYVDFEVLGDGKVLFDSGVLTNDQVDHIDVDVTGVQMLTLVANNGVPNSIDYDHADWAGAQLQT